MIPLTDNTTTGKVICRKRKCSSLHCIKKTWAFTREAESNETHCLVALQEVQDFVFMGLDPLKNKLQDLSASAASILTIPFKKVIQLSTVLNHVKKKKKKSCCFHSAFAVHWLTAWRVSLHDRIWWIMFSDENIVIHISSWYSKQKF